jgi:hypothetical protein
MYAIRTEDIDGGVVQHRHSTSAMQPKDRSFKTWNRITYWNNELFSDDFSPFQCTHQQMLCCFRPPIYGPSEIDVETGSSEYSARS